MKTLFPTLILAAIAALLVFADTGHTGFLLGALVPVVVFVITYVVMLIKSRSARVDA